jgi:hypothetical protein
MTRSKITGNHASPFNPRAPSLQDSFKNQEAIVKIISFEDEKKCEANLPSYKDEDSDSDSSTVEVDAESKELLCIELFKEPEENEGAPPEYENQRKNR